MENLTKQLVVTIFNDDKPIYSIVFEIFDMSDILDIIKVVYGVGAWDKIVIDMKDETWELIKYGI